MERDMASDELPKDNTEAVNIGHLGEVAVAEHLRGHPSVCANALIIRREGARQRHSTAAGFDHGVLGKARDPEIGDLHMQIVGDEQILGLEIPMDHTL
jgi:hypothetical protein